MTDQKIINFFLLAIIFIVLLSQLLYDLKFMTNLIQTGDYQLPVSQKPFYGFMQVPGTAPQKTEDTSPSQEIWYKLGMVPIKRQFQSNNALGADFSQVYFSAKALLHGESQYDPEIAYFKDRFDRKPNYPPLTNRLYTLLANLPYHKALIIHNFLTLIVFFAISALMLKIFKLNQYFYKTMIIFTLLYFYTPAGLAHFERGQFDLWVASSYLLIVSCVFLKKNYIFPSLAAGFLGALKWSSAPFIGTFCALAFWGSESKKKWIFCLPYLVMFISAILFFHEMKEYWPSLQLYEFQAEPYGISFMYFMPRTFSKLFQAASCLIVLILFLIFHTEKEKRINIFESISFPFAMAMFIQGMCFGTISFEYRIVSLFGLIPLYIIWIAKTEYASTFNKVIITAFFLIFITISFRIFHFFIWDLPTLSSPGMSAFYLLSSIFFLFYTCFLIVRN